MSQKFKPTHFKPTHFKPKPKFIIKEDTNSQIQRLETDVKNKEEKLKELKELQKLEKKKVSLMKWADSFNDSINDKKKKIDSIR